MLLFSPPRCESLLATASGQQTTFISRVSAPFWPSTPAPIPLSPRVKVSTREPSRPSPPQRAKQSLPRPSPIPDMSQNPGTPRASTFSPTLRCIPEVFEYESLDTLNDTPETPNAFLPEASSMTPPILTRATSWPAIIQSPSRRLASSLKVSKALRRILEADRARRRRIMKVYLKAIVFLKHLWHVNERYGNVMVTTGMYMRP